MTPNDIITWLRDKLPYAPDHAWKNVMEAIIPLLGELESRRRVGAVAVINEEENERLKERIAELEAQLAKDTNVLTNADRIRAMTDEELAAVIMCPRETGAQIDACIGRSCVECSLQWLRQPAEEVTHVQK